MVSLPIPQPARLPSSDPQEASKVHYDIAIVGLGIVGSALSASLARSGRKVLSVERDLSQPDRIVGELLQPGGCMALRALGMADALEDIGAVRVGGYTVYWGHKPVACPYPEAKVPMDWKRTGKYVDHLEGSGEWEGSEKGQREGLREDYLQQEGRSFHHGRFVQSLRRKAIESPNITVIEATANDLLQCQHTERVLGLTATPRASATDTDPSPLQFFASLVIVVDGCFSKFRRQIITDVAPIVRSNFVGLVLKDAKIPYPGTGHVILSKEVKLEGDAAKEGGVGPILVYQIGERETRMLVDVPGKSVPSMANGQMQKYLRKEVTPWLPTSLIPSFEEALATRPRSMPNSYLPAGQPQRDLESCIILGDALNMRHPLTGGGMTVGLNDARILTELLSGGSAVGEVECDRRGPVDLDDWYGVCDRLDEWHVRRKGISTCVNVLAQALYSLFGAQEEYLEYLKTGCFAYFEKGGTCVSGPVSLLSAIRPSPALLFYHFFDVAFYSIYMMFHRPTSESSPNPSLSGASKKTKYELVELHMWPILAWKSLWVLWTACVVILPVLWKEL